jgi:mono/diheme cytochrome c family protein
MIRPSRRTLLASAIALCVALGAALAQDGAQIYATHCAACHTSEGQGMGTFPPLADSEFVQGDEHPLIDIVLHGRGAMPPFAGTLGDEAVAAVLTHIRTSWGNEAEPIEPEQVAEVRDAEAAEDPAQDDVEPVEVDLPEDWFERGEAGYLQFCAACHMAGGEGIAGAFPPLADNAFVQGPADEVIRIILHGRAGMPGFAGSLDNEQIAHITSYIRNAWDNEAHLVDAEMVEIVRGGGDLDLAPTTPTTRPGAGD